MPLKAGTLAEGRTQVVLQCAKCRHEWPIEMKPPVVIVNPDRETDGGASASQAPTVHDGHDRRDTHETDTQRMRVGLCGLLRSGDRTHTVTVLYSLDAQRANGRLRLIDPGQLFPEWLHPGSRLKLSGYDGVALYIRITTVKLPREDSQADDHFAEFTVRQ